MERLVSPATIDVLALNGAGIIVYSIAMRVWYLSAIAKEAWLC